MSDKATKRVRLLKVRSTDELRDNLKRARVATGISNDSELVRFAVKQLADRSEKKEVA